MGIRLTQLFKGLITKDGSPTKRMLRIDESELVEMIRSYRESLIKPNCLSESGPQRLTAYRSSISTAIDTPSFFASAVAYDRVYFDDPIAAMMPGKSEFTFGENTLDRRRLATRIRQLKSLHCLTSEGILIPVAMSSLHETEEVPLYYTEDRFRSCLAAPVWKLAHDRAVIHPGEMAGDSMVIHIKEIDRPVRLISVSFRGDGKPSMVFRLGDASITGGLNGKVEFRIPNSEGPISKDRFDAWVDQSINQTILARLRQVGRELMQAEQLGAFYSTESSFEAELLSFANSSAGSQPAANSTNFLLANRRQLRITDPIVVTKFRSLNRSRIEDFQQSLFAMAQSINGCENFQIAATREFDRIVRPNVEALEQAWGKLKGQVVGDATLAAVGTATMLASGQSLPVAAALGALGGIGKALPGIGEYWAKRRGIAFLWHALT